MDDQQQAGASWSGAGYAAAQTGAAGDDGQPKNLWIGELQYWMDENYLWNCFAATNDVRTDIRVKACVWRRMRFSTGSLENYPYNHFAATNDVRAPLLVCACVRLPRLEDLGLQSLSSHRRLRTERPTPFPHVTASTLLLAVQVGSPFPPKKQSKHWTHGWR